MTSVTASYSVENFYSRSSGQGNLIQIELDLVKLKNGSRVSTKYTGSVSGEPINVLGRGLAATVYELKSLSGKVKAIKVANKDRDTLLKHEFNNFKKLYVDESGMPIKNIPGLVVVPKCDFTFMDENVPRSGFVMSRYESSNKASGNGHAFLSFMSEMINFQENWRHLKKENAKDEIRAKVPQIVRLAKQLLSGLAFAHHKKFWFGGDYKPGNVLMRHKNGQEEFAACDLGAGMFLKDVASIENFYTSSNYILGRDWQWLPNGPKNISNAHVEICPKIDVFAAAVILTSFISSDNTKYRDGGNIIETDISSMVTHIEPLDAKKLWDDFGFPEELTHTINGMRDPDWKTRFSSQQSLDAVAHL